MCWRAALCAALTVLLFFGSAGTGTGAYADMGMDGHIPRVGIIKVEILELASRFLVYCSKCWELFRLCVVCWPWRSGVGGGDERGIAVSCKLLTRRLGSWGFSPIRSCLRGISFDDLVKFQFSFVCSSEAHSRMEMDRPDYDNTIP